VQRVKDVLIIGAGAAGLAAGDRLRQAGLDATVLEARERVGGRAWTSYDLAHHPVELGAEFIHGENVVTWRYVERFGLSTTDQTTVLNIHGLHEGRRLHQQEFVVTTGMRMSWATHAAADEHRVGTLLDAMRAWCDKHALQPSPDDWAIWTAYCGQYFAADPSALGAAEFHEATYDGDGTRLQFRLQEGYSAICQRLAADLDVIRASPVREITWSPEGVRVSSDAATYEARRAIVTLPLAILQRNDVTFTPQLPEPKQQAINRLGAGANGKIVLVFDEPCWPQDMTLFLSGRDTQLWWRPGRLREDEAPVITAYFGGSAVERFRAMGEAAPLAAMRDLEDFFGVKLESRLRNARFVDWPADPHARMSYSYIPPGGAGLRANLAEPLDGVLYFAGEASNSVRPSTVHGALESGIRAADEVIAAVG
jgi:monoamine oxidase